MDNTFASCFIEQTGSNSQVSLSVFFCCGFSGFSRCFLSLIILRYLAAGYADLDLIVLIGQGIAVAARRSASVFTLRMEDLMFGNEFHLLIILVLQYSIIFTLVVQEF